MNKNILLPRTSSVNPSPRVRIGTGILRMVLSGKLDRAIAYLVLRTLRLIPPATRRRFA